MRGCSGILSSLCMIGGASPMLELEGGFRNLQTFIGCQDLLAETLGV